MDSRGSTVSNYLENPEGALEALGATRGVVFPHLTAAREATNQRVADLRQQVASCNEAEDLPVVVCGSSARGEWTAESDDDWAVITSGETHINSLDASLDTCKEVLGIDVRAPGDRAYFGCSFGCQDLINHIGLDADDNTNLTRRMLLLLESVPLTGMETYDDCWNRVLDAYFERDLKDYRPPRFLLNDVIRYWRTVCVDFEGKHRGPGNEDDRKWVERNSKLRLSRKLLFAGGLIPTLLCHQRDVESMRGFLRTQLRAVALDRVAAAFLACGANDEGARAMGAYDEWLAIMQSPDKRAELRALTERTRNESPLFSQIRELGNRFERGLLALLFETELGRVTRQYGIF